MATSSPFIGLDTKKEQDAFEADGFSRENASALADGQRRLYVAVMDKVATKHDIQLLVAKIEESQKATRRFAFYLATFITVLVLLANIEGLIGLVR